MKKALDKSSQINSSSWLEQKKERFETPWGSMVEIAGVEGFLIPGDVKFVYDIAASLPANGTYLEIGCFMGLSAITAAMSLEEHENSGGRVVTIDNWLGSPEHQDMGVIQHQKLQGVFRANVDRLNINNRISECTGESTEVANFFKDESIDIIFIDGNHSFEATYADLQAWYPKLKKSGVIFGHDASPDINELSGVRVAISQFAMETGRKIKLTPPPASHYMWELR